MSALHRLRRGAAALAAGIGAGLLACWLLAVTLGVLAIYSIAILASVLVGRGDDR